MGWHSHAHAGTQQILDAIAIATGTAQGRERLLARAGEVATQIQETVQAQGGTLDAIGAAEKGSIRATFAGARGELGARPTAHQARLGTDAAQQQGQLNAWQAGAFSQADATIGAARTEVAALQSSHVQQAQTAAQEDAQATTAALNQAAQTARTAGHTGVQVIPRDGGAPTLVPAAIADLDPGTARGLLGAADTGDLRLLTVA